MQHEMRLKEAPFAKIKNGEKTVELRLCDEKRRQIRVGDTLCFYRADGERGKLLCRVTALHTFASFAELYAALPHEKLGYARGEHANYTDMEAYYTKEEQKKYGVIGIELVLVSVG